MPRVSVGLPVYNGGKFLRTCLESLLGQTFTDFEIVICDNASTDDTGAICQEFAARDSRIRYFRNPQNIGAGPNYNLTFERATGVYFKWAAHDDVCEPSFLERCVEALDQDPSLVLAYPMMVDIDDEGRKLGVRNISHIPRAERGSSPKPHKRFRNLIRLDYTVEEIFGVIRSDALRRSVLIKSYTDSDRTLLAQLALYGRFVEIPEVLFLHRLHAGMSTRVFVHWQERTAWFDPASVGRPVYPLRTQLAEYLRVILRAPISVYSKGWCYFWMVNWIRRRWRELAEEIRFAREVRRKARGGGGNGGSGEENRQSRLQGG
jgi:glycosyltransferase involved in cell wall biosynthesis